MLEKSILSELLIQLKQSYDMLSPSCHGGLTLFKLLVDKLDAKTYKNTKLLQNYITSFCFDAIPGKSVATGTVCFKTAAKMLALFLLPTDLIQRFIQGISFSSNGEFKSTCTVQLGFTESPMFEE